MAESRFPKPFTSAHVNLLAPERKAVSELFDGTVEDALVAHFGSVAIRRKTKGNAAPATTYRLELTAVLETGDPVDISVQKISTGTFSGGLVHLNWLNGERQGGGSSYQTDNATCNTIRQDISLEGRQLLRARASEILGRSYAEIVDVADKEAVATQMVADVLSSLALESAMELNGLPIDLEEMNWLSGLVAMAQVSLEA